MDDFGTGHFAPHAALFDAARFHPAYRDYVARRDPGYTPAEALAFSRRAMPTLSALAGSGALFTNACASSNLCAPSRAGLLTGRLQNRFGLFQNSDVEAAGLPAGSVLAGRLREAGYATGFIGKWHAGRRDESLRLEVLRQHGVTPASLAKLAPGERGVVDREIRETGYLGAVAAEHHPLRHGFDYYFGYNRWECPFYDSEHIWEDWKYAGLQREYNTHLFTNKALDFVARSRKQGKPFFVQIAYHAVHGPLKPKAPQQNFARFQHANYELNNFYAHVSAVDDSAAELRSALGAQWENTLFFFTGDNGAPVDLATPLPGNGPYRSHKGSFHLGGFRVPMLVHWPARLRNRQQRNELVSLLDVMPTALEAAGVAAPAGLDGRSLLPLLTGKQAKVHDHLALAGIHARAWGFTRETVIGPAEQRREESPGAWVVTDGRYLLRFTTATPAGLFRDLPEGAPAGYELYDLREDPGESRNLAAQLPQVVSSLREVWHREARDFPSPARWRSDRWNEMAPPQP
jgi:uncharacterized sulfatase